jgi:hypothetical protein
MHFQLQLWRTFWGGQSQTYDTVLKRHKSEGHAKVAQWLAGLADQGSLRAGDFLGPAAEHFEQAGDDANAAEFHARAAELAGQRLAHERVLLHVGQARGRWARRCWATEPFVPVGRARAGAGAAPRRWQRQ